MAMNQALNQANDTPHQQKINQNLNTQTNEEKLTTGATRNNLVMRIVEKCSPR